jgi:two-component system, NarL family, nitrate/nitrite response regulator NarL
VPEQSTQQQFARVLVVSETRLYRESLAALLSRSGVVTVVGTAESTADILRTWPPHSYDLVLFDLAPGSAWAGVHEFLRKRPSSRIVGIGLSGDAVTPPGVADCVYRDAGLRELVEAIERLRVYSSGGTPHPTAVRRFSAKHGSERAHLTAREFEVLDLIETGLSNREIGERLHIEVTTVKNHVHSILRKLNVKNRALAGAWLRRDKIGRRFSGQV